MKWKIPLFKSYWDEKDIDAVTKVIKRGTCWSSGPEIKELEKKIAKFVGTKHALTFNSGTSALHVDFLSHNLSKGEVIMPSFTFIATANAAVLAGAKPIFAEIEEKSYGLDPEYVKEKINKKTKAIVAVHYAGAPCKEIKALRDIAKDENILLIEDAAESLGSKINKEMVGTFGDSAMFSFCQNKVITSGEGGIIVTDSTKFYEKIKLLRSHGRVEKDTNYFSTQKQLDYVEAGYNFRMSSISSALVLSQLKKIDKIIKLRRGKAEYFNKKLSRIISIDLPKEYKNTFHVYQMYTVRLEDKKMRDKLQNYLTDAGIMTKTYFEPVHLKSYYKEKFKYKKGDLPLTEEISKKVLTIPLYPSLTYEEMDYIIDKIKKCCE